MLITGTWDECTVAISDKPSGLIVSLQHKGETDVFSYDGAGRLWAVYLGSTPYRRALNGRMIVKWRASGMERQRRWLSRDESLQIEQRAYRLMQALSSAISSGDIRLNDSLPSSARAGLERILAFDTARSIADVVRYEQIYTPVGILPPDQYMAVVLQATQGCSFNTCIFCDFYKNRSFRIKSPAEFRAHARAVRDFLGEGLALRRSVFLGDANALVIPMPKLLLFDITREVFDLSSMTGIYAFLDGFSGEKKSSEDYRALVERGLKRVYIGMESGSADLLRFLKKPGSPDDAIQAVESMKRGGVAVGIIVLLGAGGVQFAERHICATIDALNSMPLDADDLIYFSELVVNDQMAYARDANQTRLEPLSSQACAEQGKAIENGLRFADPNQRPRISCYDIREFVY